MVEPKLPEHLPQPLKPIVPPEERFTKPERAARGTLFILAGLFIGFGFGFMISNVVAGMFIGCGIGFAVFAISLFSRR